MTYILYHQIINPWNTPGDTIGTGIVYPSENITLPPVFSGVGICAIVFCR